MFETNVKWFFAYNCLFAVLFRIHRYILVGIKVVDVYDALRSKRVYKEAYSNEVTREIIMLGRGKHFNPLIVDAFLAFEQEFDIIFASLKDY